MSVSELLYDPYAYKKWSAKRQRALSYVVGVLLRGDGTVCMYTSHEKLKTRHGIKPYLRRYYIIQLKVKSKLFAEKFNKEMAIVLNRKPVKIYEYRGMYIVRYKNKAFVKWWLDNNIPENTNIIKPLIIKYPRDYLLGQFDSDGSVDIIRYRVKICGPKSSLKILQLDRDLCIKLGMRTSKIEQYYDIGYKKEIDGRTIIAKEPGYRFEVSAIDFINKIGFLNVESRKEKLNYLKEAIIDRKYKNKPINEVKKQLINMVLSGKRLSEAVMQLKVPYKLAEKWIRKHRKKR